MKRLAHVSVTCALSLASCTAETTTEITYEDESGSVWYATDCPDADVLLTGGADGLPEKGQTDLDNVQSAVGEGGRSSVKPRNGQVWQRAPDGTIRVTSVHDYMIQTEIDDASQCPPSPVSANGIPVAYVIVGE